MLPRDFLLLVAICVVWAMNLVVSKLVVADMNVPPLFYAAMRSLVVALAVWPWLFPMPRPRWRLVMVALLMGGGGFALLFIGLRTASPSAAAIVQQLGVPMTAMLSIAMLGERVGWRRGIGIGLTLAGAAMVVWDGDGFTMSRGLLFVAAGAFAGSLGAVMMKQIEGVRPLQFQAWVGAASTLLLAILSAGLETGQAPGALQAGWPFLASVLFSGLVVSVVAHTAFYGLLQKYEANLIAPLTLMSPLMAVLMGIAVTGDRLDARIVAGAGLALLGVPIVAVQPGRAMPAALVVKGRA